MPSRLFNAVVLLSLALFSVTSALWTWSTIRYDVWYTQPWDPVRREAGQNELELGNGHIVLQHYETLFAPGIPSPTDASTRLHHLTATRSKSADVTWLQFNHGPGMPGVSPWWRVQVQLWPVVALTAALPLQWLWGLARRLQIKAGCCRNCGYDLRATPERCPECGMVAAGKNVQPGWPE